MLSKVEITNTFSLSSQQIESKDSFETALHTFSNIASALHKDLKDSPILPEIKSTLHTIIKTRRNYKLLRDSLQTRTNFGLSEQQLKADYLQGFTLCEQQLSQQIEILDAFHESHDVAFDYERDKYVVGNQITFQQAQQQVAHQQAVQQQEIQQQGAQQPAAQQQEAQQPAAQQPAAQQPAAQQPADQQPAVPQPVAPQQDPPIRISNKPWAFKVLIRLPDSSVLYNNVSITPQLRFQRDTEKNWYAGIEAQISLSLGKKIKSPYLEASAVCENISLGFTIRDENSFGKKVYSFEAGVTSKDFSLTRAGCKAIIQFPLNTDNILTNININSNITFKSFIIKTITQDNKCFTCCKPSIDLNYQPFKKKLTKIKKIHVDDLVTTQDPSQDIKKFTIMPSRVCNTNSLATDSSLETNPVKIPEMQATVSVDPYPTNPYPTRQGFFGYSKNSSIYVYGFAISLALTSIIGLGVGFFKKKPKK